MTDVGNGIPRPSRPFECPMPLPVTDRRATITPDPSFLAAGADVAEADAAQRIASDPSVIDAERDPLYGDRVKRHEKEVCTCSPSWVVHVLCPVHGYQSARDEHKRRARLSQWQERR